MPSTIAATCAFFRVNVAGAIDQCNGEITWLALNVFYFTVCDKVYVQMPADLDQFG